MAIRSSARLPRRSDSVTFAFTRLSLPNGGDGPYECVQGRRTSAQYRLWVPSVVNISDGHSSAVRMSAEEWDRLDAACAITGEATVSCCIHCRARVLATRVVNDLVAPVRGAIDGAHEVFDLCEEAPLLHVFVSEEPSRCRHVGWRDPGHTEWSEMVAHATLRRR